MELELVTVERNGYAPPFAEHDGFKERWWGNPRLDDRSHWRYLRVLRGGLEVARVKLDEVVYIDHYADTPPLGAMALQIELIEVSEKCRLKGIGKAVVRRIAELHPDRRLVAYSEGGDEFWTALGWRRHENPTKPGSQPLFIQPERWH